MSDCDRSERLKYLKANRIKVRDLCVKNITAQNITAENITAQNLTTQNITAQNLTAQNLTAQNIKTKTLETGDLIAKGNVYFDLHEFVLQVGADKPYKSIQDAINVLENKIVFGTIRIKVDPGIYSGFSVSGFEVLNQLPVYIDGDMRLIAGQTYINNLDDKYYTFTFEVQGNETKIQILENFSNTSLPLALLGLTVGDKIVFYNDDPSVNPKSLRFSEATVTQVTADSFNVDTIVTGLNVNSSITFLPNVFVKPTVQGFNNIPPLFSDGVSSSPFPYLSDIFLENNSIVTGITCLEPDTGFTSAPAILNASPASILINVVVKSTTWNTVTLDSVVYEGFKTSSGYLDDSFNQITFSTFVVLGTGFNPDFYPNGPVSINNAANSILSFVSIIGSVENLTSNGTLFFYNSNCQLKNVNIVGTQALVGLLASKSTIYDSSNILITDSVEGIVAADSSFVEVNDSIVQKYDIAIISEHLSKMIFKNLNLSDGTQDFCIQDLSQILRDNIVVIAPSC